MFNTKKTRKRTLRIIQKSKNKWQRIKGTRRNDLLDDMEFSMRKELIR